MNGVKKNFFYNVVYQGLTFLIPIIITPYLSRVLGAEKTGVYAYAYSIVSYFILFVMLGVNNYGNREIAKVRDDEKKKSQTFWAIYAMQLLLGAFVLICYIIYCTFWGNTKIDFMMTFFVLAAILDVNWFFWGLEEFKLTIIRNIIVKILTLIGIFAFVKTPNDLDEYTLIMATSMLLSSLMIWPYLKKRVKWYRPTYKEIIQHLKPNSLLFIPVLAVSLYKIMDKLMLGLLGSYLEVGYYEYAEKVIVIPVCIINSLGTVMLPRMSNIVGKGKECEEFETIRKSLFWGIILTAAMCFGLMAVADVFVPFFYGSGYAKCEMLFYILLPSCIFLAIANVIRTQYLIPHSMDRQYTISLILGAGVNLLMNILLIPSFKSTGAAFGTLLAEITVCVYQIICVKKFFPILKYLKDVWYGIICSIIMFWLVYSIPIIKTYLITLLVKVLCGMVFFCIVFIGIYFLLFKIKRGKR